ncbi:MAG: hypothetical protein JWR19_842 [Pedosphaera sp.]|nr:hypothetical protein [Pedosphaera sp.]
MNTTIHFAPSISKPKTGRRLAVGLSALLVSLPLIGAEHGGAAPHAAAPRSVMSAPRPVVVDRSNHGSIRHVDTHINQRPVEVRRVPEQRIEPRRDIAPRREIEPRRDVFVHRDVDVDIHRRHFSDDFAFGRRLSVLPVGFFALQIGGVPYFYNDGIYYQPVTGGYQEVYPPVGAAVTQLPDGAIAIDAGGQTYYYAGGAFYLLQPDGTYVIAPTPIGVVVPELPPGAVPVSVNGTIAYQFNGIYYEPVFINGVTQYETFMP